MTFGGEFRGGADADPEADSQAAKSIWASRSRRDGAAPGYPGRIAAVVAGFLVNPIVDIGIVPAHWLSDFLHGKTEDHSTVSSPSGSHFSARGRRRNRPGLPDVLRQEAHPRAGGEARSAQVYNLLLHKYYFDEAIRDHPNGPRLLRDRRRSPWTGSTSRSWTASVRLVDSLGRNVGRAMAHAQTGQLQGYGIVVSMGVIVAIFAVVLPTEVAVELGNSQDCCPQSSSSRWPWRS